MTVEFSFFLSFSPKISKNFNFWFLLLHFLLYVSHKDDANCKIFLLGAKEGIAAKAMEHINERVGRQMVVGAHSPSFGFEKHEDECEELVRIVNESGANVLLVGVGAPK